MAVGYGDSKIEPIPQKDCKNMELSIDMQGIVNIILIISYATLGKQGNNKESIYE